jgi:hypothetical protein
VRKYTQRSGNEKKGFSAHGTSGKRDFERGARQQQQQKSRNDLKRNVQESDEEDLVDEEDLRIAELEKRLGIHKEGKSKGGEDGLDGTCKRFLT